MTQTIVEKLMGGRIGYPTLYDKSTDECAHSMSGLPAWGRSGRTNQETKTPELARRVETLFFCDNLSPSAVS